MKQQKFSYSIKKQTLNKKLENQINFLSSSQVHHHPHISSHTHSFLLLLLLPPLPTTTEQPCYHRHSSSFSFLFFFSFPLTATQQPQHHHHYPPHPDPVLNPIACDGGPWQRSGSGRIQGQGSLRLMARKKVEGIVSPNEAQFRRKRPSTVAAAVADGGEIPN